MRSLDVVVASSNAQAAEGLAKSLNGVFRSVHVVNSADDLRAAIARKHPRVVISDLETVALDQVEKLNREFNVQIVCTHRIPDENMWTTALSHGAIDCCHTSDTKSIVQAVSRNMARSQAA